MRVPTRHDQRHPDHTNDASVSEFSADPARLYTLESSTAPRAHPADQLFRRIAANLSAS